MIVKNKTARQEFAFQKKAGDICTHSGSSHGPLITDSIRGEILCASCGSVLADKVEDLGPEQRSFTMDDYTQNSRTGLASTLSIHDKGLSTVIGNADKDASGNSISSYMKYAFNRLRTWDSRSKSNSSDRNLKTAFVIMSSVQSKLEISDTVIERAAYLYRKAMTKNIIRGRTISGMILSALYVACRESNVPRTLQDVASAGNVSFKDLSRHYRILVKSLDLHVESFNPLEFVSKIGTSVGLSEKAKRDALDILHRAHEKGITDGKNPVSLAATAVFLSGVINEEKITQNSIAKASGVSSVTIRNVARTLRKQLGMDA
ncbi:MAG TPA: transcription initiation factor IIB [Candidatus Nitrosotalea sp.]|nr:transcription initiation factor IIB [Candidatus Nitrosotalea sp.]